MIAHIEIYLQGVKTAVAARMAYRVDYFISFFIMMIMELILPMVTLLIYQAGGEFPGWKYHEVFLLQGVFLLAKGIVFPFFAGMVWNTIERIRDGVYDLLLIKPRNILFLSIVTAIDAEDLGKFIGGLAFFSAALYAQPDLHNANVFLFIILLGCSVFVFASFCFFMAGSAFKWVGNFRVYEIFDSVIFFGMYPRSIFSKGVQTLITSVIPVTLMGFYPAAALLGRVEDGVLAALCSSFVLFVSSLIFWKIMLRGYSSAGG